MQINVIGRLTKIRGLELGIDLAMANHNIKCFYSVVFQMFSKSKCFFHYSSSLLLLFLFIFVIVVVVFFLHG